MPFKVYKDVSIDRSFLAEMRYKNWNVRTVLNWPMWERGKMGWDGVEGGLISGERPDVRARERWGLNWLPKERLRNGDFGKKYSICPEMWLPFWFYTGSLKILQPCRNSFIAQTQRNLKSLCLGRGLFFGGMCGSTESCYKNGMRQTTPRQDVEFTHLQRADLISLSLCWSLLWTDLLVVMWGWVMRGGPETF